MAYETEPYRQFTGLNKNTAALDSVLPTELIEAQNIMFDPRGGYSNAWGRVRHTPNALDANPINTLIYYKRKNGTPLKLYASGAKLWKDNGDGTATTIFTTLASSTLDWFYWSGDDKLYFNDGTNYYRTDGTTVEVVPPATGTDINLTGVKRCKVHEWYPMWFRHFWGADSNDMYALYYSEDTDPTKVKSADGVSTTSKVYPISNIGKLTTIKTWKDSVLIGYEDGWMKWTGGGVNVAIDASWRPVKASSGPTSKRGVIKVGENLVYTAKDGVYILESADITAEDNARKISKDINPLYQSLTNKDKMAAVYDGRFLLIACCDGSVNYNNTVLCADFEIMEDDGQPAWSVWPNVFANDFILVDDVVYYGHSNNGLVMKFDKTSGQNDGVDMPWVAEHYFTLYDRSGRLNPFAVTKVKELHIAGQQLIEHVGLKVTVTCDYDNSTFDVDLDDSFSWGKEWGKRLGWIDHISRGCKIGKKARRVRVRLEGAGRFILTAIGLEYKPGKTKGEKNGVKSTN